VIDALDDTCRETRCGARIAAVTLVALASRAKLRKVHQVC
jgi:hypothetical protein